jgi:hypothetical protein
LNPSYPKPFEHWEHEILEQVEEKIAPIRSSLLNFKQNQDKEVAKLEGELLRTQKFIAMLGVHYSANICHALILQYKPKEDERFFAQIVAAASAARTEIKASNDPLSVAGKFHEKWSSKLENEGIPTVQLAP